MEPYSQVVDIIKNYQLQKNLLNNHEPELGNNNNTGGGAAMETLCEIGVTTADLICKKYNNSNNSLCLSLFKSIPRPTM